MPSQEGGLNWVEADIQEAARGSSALMRVAGANQPSYDFGWHIRYEADFGLSSLRNTMI